MSDSLVQLIDPPELGPGHPAYANIIKVSLGEVDLITIAGQVATRPNGEIPESLEEQVDLVFSKVQACLAAVGARVQDLTRLVYYMVEYDGIATREYMIKKMIAFLNGHRPASCLLVVKSLSKPEFKLEIEGQAVVRRV